MEMWDIYDANKEKTGRLQIIMKKYVRGNRKSYFMK